MLAKCFFLLLLLFSLFAQSQIGSIIDYHSSSKTENNQSQKQHIRSLELKKLAAKITKFKSTDADKSRAIYLWITKNIAYDYELKFNKKLQQEFYISEAKVVQKVLQRRKALCGGFAFLFEKLCKQVGIKARTVHGFTKQAVSSKVPNHSWNAVKLNNTWQLLDITWSLSDTSAKAPEWSWYLTHPKIFIKSHYPKNRNWALLDEVTNLKDFVFSNLK